MAPPGLFGSTKRLKPKARRIPKPADKKVTKVEKQTRSTTREKRLLFSRFPAEIQQNIWAEALSKPACHTFKFVRSRDDGTLSRWDVNIQPVSKGYDPSSYRLWKSLLHCKPKNDGKDGAKDDDKLKNMSFQAGFRRAMLQFQPIMLRIPGPGDAYRQAAAINAETDLVIIEFERGSTAPAYSWFEHSTTHMDLNAIRQRAQHFRRVAIHYKAAYKTADNPGPFHCYCPPPVSLGCHNYKACCFELACFLDCFKSLEEFYFVVDIKNSKEKRWADSYRERVREQRYQFAKSAEKGGGTIEVSHFFDTKNEYVQHCAPGILKGFLRTFGKELAESPFIRPHGPRECLTTVRDIYRGITQDEKFVNSQEKRNQTKFGLLIACPREKAQRAKG